MAMRLWKAGGLLAAAAAVGTAGAALIDNGHLKVTRRALYHTDLPAAFDGLRVVHLSDLHAASFGKDQQTLLDTIDGIAPDLVLITGDLIDRRRTVTDHDMHPALLLLQELARRVPTVRVDGNHEPQAPAGYRFKMLADRTGVQNVTGRGLAVRKGDDSLVIVGIPDVVTFQYDDEAWRQTMHTVCAPYAQQFRIALSHRPQYLADYAAEGLPFVLCGHAHGGQVRLPFIGGLYAPEQGIFPKYTAGIHECGGTQMLVSRGLGNSGFPLRFNNRPEVCLVTLKKTDV